MKYKEAGNGEYILIFSDTERTASWNERNSPGRFEEMRKWVAEGNEIEPQFTAAELAAKEAAEAKQALESQNKTIINLVKSAEYHFSPVSRHPDTEGKWKQWVTDLWTVYDSGKVQTLPEKPFDS